MVIGCLGDIVFKTSSRYIKTIDNARWTGSARYAEHQRHMWHAATEALGLNPDTMTFDIYLDYGLNVDVMADLNKIWQYEREFATLPLVIGEKPYGKYRWCIKSNVINMEHYDRWGNLMSAKVTLSLLEYINF
jgi:hypothetical protein